MMDNQPTSLSQHRYEKGDNSSKSHSPYDALRHAERLLNEHPDDYQQAIIILAGVNGSEAIWEKLSAGPMTRWEQLGVISEVHSNTSQGADL